MAGDFGFGTLLAVGVTSANTTVAQVVSIDGPGYSLDTIDVTAHDSSTSNFREFIAGLRDAGEVSFELNFDPDGTTHKAASGGLIYILEEATEQDWVLTMPDTSTCSFTGFLTSFEPSFPHDDKITASGTIKITGKPTWAYS